MVEQPELPERNWLKRGVWFVGLWLAGLAVVGTVAFAIRSMIL